MLRTHEYDSSIHTSRPAHVRPLMSLLILPVAMLLVAAFAVGAQEVEILTPVAREAPIAGEEAAHLRLLKSEDHPDFVLDRDPAFQIRRVIEGWREAWAGQAVDEYLSYYSSSFQPQQGSLASWRRARSRAVARPDSIELVISKVDYSFPVSDRSPVEATVTFVQRYATESYEDLGLKTLHMEKAGERWVIAREQFEELGSN